VSSRSRLFALVKPSGHAAYDGDCGDRGTVRTGTRVEVRTRFESNWTRGFEIADRDDTRDPAVYKVRRRSDGTVLPVMFSEDDLREERRRSTWWI
jgi:hypothetical protein